MRSLSKKGLEGKGSKEEEEEVDVEVYPSLLFF